MLDKLPSELILTIASHLDLSSQVQLAQSSPKLYVILKNSLKKLNEDFEHFLSKEDYYNCQQIEKIFKNMNVKFKIRVQAHLVVVYYLKFIKLFDTIRVPIYEILLGTFVRVISSRPKINIDRFPFSNRSSRRIEDRLLYEVYDLANDHLSTDNRRIPYETILDMLRYTYSIRTLDPPFGTEIRMPQNQKFIYRLFDELPINFFRKIPRIHKSKVEFRIYLTTLLGDQIFDQSDHVSTGNYSTSKYIEKSYSRLLSKSSRKEILLGSWMTDSVNAAVEAAVNKELKNNTAKIQIDNHRISKKAERKKKIIPNQKRNPKQISYSSNKIQLRSKQWKSRK